ncbi:MAG TPA: hypothetical protein PLN43_06615, partial [Anaerolineales bacterium]|nr:hypothetical protein [Anaerolineales bacterium]
MKTSSKFVFSMLAVLMLLAMLFGAAPVQSVRAEAAESPLAAGSVWTKSMGGTAIDQGYSIAADSIGNLYATGAFMGTVDFDPGVNTFN